jgi:hypothetical protein
MVAASPQMILTNLRHRQQSTSKCAMPSQRTAVSTQSSKTFDQATIMLNLVGDNLGSLPISAIKNARRRFGKRSIFARAMNHRVIHDT